MAAEIAAGTPAEAVGLQRGDLLIAIDDRPIENLRDVIAALHAARPGALLRYTVLRLGSRDVVDLRVAPVPGRPGALYYRADVGGHLHPARGRRGPPAAAARSGHAALPVAGGRVLRRLHVLFQRAARPAGLGLLLGRRHRHPRAAATLPRLHDGLPGPSAHVGPGSDDPCAVRPHLRAGDHPGPDACGGSGPQLERRAAIRPDYRRARPARVPVPGRLLHRRAAGADAGARPRDVHDGTPAAEVDCVGHGPGRLALRAGLRAALRAGRGTVVADAAVGHPAQPDPAGLCLGHRAVPAAGHRNHPEACADLRHHRGGGRLDVRRPPRGGTAPVPIAGRRAGLGDRASSAPWWRCCWRRP